MGFQQQYWNIRRWLLKTLVPEFVWPKEILVDGVVIALKGTPYSYGTKKGIKDGVYEIHERSLLKGKIQPGDVIIEMGGSVGVVTAILGKYAGDSGKVISVEASEKITAYSKSWLEAKGNIKVLTGFGFPVFSLDRKINIHSFNEQSGSLGGTLLFDVEEIDEDTNGNEQTIFDIEKISRLHHIQPTALVVDVEGSEKIITSVKPNYPSSVRLILMEMHEHLYGAAVRDRIIAAIVEDGFHIQDQQHGVYLFERN